MEPQTHVPVAFSQFSKQELIEAFREVVVEEVRRFREEALTEKLLSPEETRKLFTPSITRATLHNWTKDGKLQTHYIPGSTKVFYKYTEVMAALQTLKKYKR